MKNPIIYPLVVCLVVGAALCAQNPVASKLERPIDLLDLRDATLRDAIRIIAEETGLNVVASEEAGQKTISCFLQGVTTRQAIESIAKTFGMWYREDESSGIIRMMTAKEFERDLATFRDEKTQVFTLLFPNAVDVAVAVRNLFGSRVRLSLDREIMNDEYREILQRFQRFDILDRRGQSLGVFGGQTGINDFGSSQNGNGLFNNSSTEAADFRSTRGVDDDDRDRRRAESDANSPALTPDQLETLQKALAASGDSDGSLLEKLRGAQPSIFVTIMRRSNTIAVRSADGPALKEIERLVRRLDVPTPQVLLEVKILGLDLGDDFNSVFDSSYMSGLHSVGFENGNVRGGTGLFDPGAFIYQYVSDSFAARLQLLQEKNRVVTLATPTLLVANNEVARLFIGEERPIVRNISSQTTVNQNAVTTTPQNTVEIRPVGTTLLITPNINADRTISLRVLQENSDVKTGAASIPVVTSTGEVINQPVDVVGSRSVSGTVIAKDGLSLALGGLVQEGIEIREEGIPGLMDIPLLGMLFRREAKMRTHQELVILIRPFVLFTPTEGQEISRRLADRLLIHPSAASMGRSLGAFDKSEVPNAPLTSDPLKELLQYQSGLPTRNDRR